MSTAPPPIEFDVVGKFEAPSPDPNRAGKFDVFITYRIVGDAMHQFSLRLPKESSAAEQIKAAVRADYTEQQKLIGFRFT